MSTAVSFETRFPIADTSGDFPFECELSLAPLIGIWKNAACNGQSVAALFHRQVLDATTKAPELLNPIDDLSLLDRHRELVDVLMTEVFPPASWMNDYAAAMLPFQLRSFYSTPAFKQLLSDSKGGVRGLINLDREALESARLLNAYALILRHYYNIELGFDYPIIITTEDPETGLNRHFRVQFDRQFLQVKALGEVKSLNDHERHHLLANLADPTVLMATIQPNGFAFYGFWVLKATDVTDQEVLSSLKEDLIEKDSIVSPAQFQKLQTGLRTLLRRPALRLALAAIHGDEVLLLNQDNRAASPCIFADSDHRAMVDFKGSVYERAMIQARPQIIEDLSACLQHSAIEDALLAAGAHTVVVGPLYYRDRLTGWIELTSPRPGDLDAMNTMKLREVMPIFSIALWRGLEELNDRVEGVIKANCTAIHPSVEWRFRQAALQSLGRGDREPTAMEPIVFRDVYPLFASADIRDSSMQRNLAIQADLIARLRLAREVVLAARDAKPLPLLDELAYRINRRLEQVEKSLNSGDELALVEFLRDEVESWFDQFEHFDARARDRVREYRAKIAEPDGAIHCNRRAYEESVTLINDTISPYLDKEQQAAQAIYPHYFEKQCTDGIDYTIYVGTSMAEKGHFSELYLKNLRLWQLIVSCGIAHQIHSLQDKLRVALQTTQLILVHHAPLAVRFLVDEKRFGVDGAYNMRYGVIKRRIDKAVIKGTAERVTQPGKIAIIYSQPSEAAEYRDYLDYLRAYGCLSGVVEDLDLDELQGVQGLRALRVAVNLAALPSSSCSTRKRKEDDDGITAGAIRSLK